MADIYADEGITGTKVAVRQGFQRMIRDCMDGQIDIILTKSVSRFSRNTVDTIQYVRMLKEKGIAVIFEKEGINTMTEQGEMFITLMSTLAQNEVESLSQNVKMGIRMKQKRGEMMGFNGCLGYDYHPEDKSITVNEEEAETVRLIFELYLQGYGTYTIARQLTEMGIFGKRKIRIEDIVSVVLLEQTQNYSKRTRSGLVFGNSIFNPDVVLMDGNAEPTGATYTFSVTLKDGSKDIVKADSGTAICDRLLQMALDGESVIPMDNEQLSKDKKAPELQKNQLPQGVYKVGRDIPVGVFDFHHVWGNGRIHVYKAEETILRNLTFGDYIGDTYEYEKMDCINVICENGWYVHISGNLIVSISRSKDIELDL